MSTDPRTILKHATRLVGVVTGDPYGDGKIVTDIGVGYAGGTPDAVWVAGDWNNKTEFDPETRTFTTLDDTPSRLAAALERIGVEVEWLDTGSTCHECGLWVQTEPDSYFWQPDYLLTEHGDFLCGECVREDPEVLVSEYVNDADKAITAALLDDVDLEDYGFKRHPDGEHRDYLNGLHTGWNDNPRTITDGIRAEHGDGVDVIFVITEVQQFGLRFEAYYRAEDWQDDTED